MECPLSVYFSVPAQTSAVGAHIWQGTLGQHFIAYKLSCSDLGQKLVLFKTTPMTQNQVGGRTSVGIPQLEGLIFAAAKNRAAVRGEGAGTDKVRVPAQRALFSTCPSERRSSSNFAG